MKQTKRILSFLICLAMVLSLLSVAAFAATPSKLYMKPSKYWKDSGARFAAYFFGDGETWVSMTDSNGDGIYEVDVPTGKSFTHVIFCRMNPSNSADNWNNKWNQTSDLPIPTNGTNMYTIKEGTWDKGGGTWSTYVDNNCKHENHDQDGHCTNPDCGVLVAHEFTDGTCLICGAADPDYVSITVYCINSSNWAEVTAYAWTDGGASMGWPGEKMTKTENTVNGFDVYEITLHTAYENIIFNNNNNGYQTGDQILMAGQYFDVKDATWYASLEDVPEVEDPGVTEPVAPSYYVAGDMNGWNNCDAAYIMNAEADGIYTLTFAVTAGDYGLKVTDGTWDNSWGKDGGNYTFKAYTDGEVTVTFNTADFSVNVTGECLTDPTPECEHPSHGQDGKCTACGDVVPHSFKDGVCTICAAADPDYTDITVYCINSANWSEVAAYAWNDGGTGLTWPGELMTKTENTVNGFDVYEITLHTAYENIIFNNNNNGYQTGDQILMAGQYFDVKDAIWYASLEDVPEVEDPGVTEPVAPSYYVAGDMNGWNSCDAAYIMNAEADGIYTLTFAVTAGDYGLKVTDGTWNNSWGKDGGNYNIKAYTDGEVTVTFNTADFSVNVTGECLTDPTPACEHTSHDQDGNCTDCGVYVGHSFVDGVCSCGKTEEVVVPSVNYIVAGTSDLCGAGSTGYGWDSSDLSNLMTDNGDGTFSKVYSNVLPGDGYELKIVEEIDGNYTWIGVDGGADNMIFNVTDTCDVTVTFNPETKEITVTGEYVVLPGSELEVEYITVTGNGDGTWLNGASWDPADLSNQMYMIYQDYYAITYSDVEGFDNYQVKFTADGSWANNWGGVYMDSGIESNAVYNGDNITITVPYELAEVTLILDLMNYDHSTKTGAKFTVYVTETSPDCEHTSHDLDGNCTNCGEYVGHSFDENYACACGKTIETVTVYFQNNWLWREVSIFFWGSELADPTWPGYSMEFYDSDGLYDVYSYNIPVDVKGVIINGKKDDGSNTLDQTPDITEGFYDGICYYMTWDNGNAVGSLNVELLFCEHENHDQEGNCTNCGTAVAHTGGDVVVEKEVTGDCYTDSSYDNVTYCTICNVEISRETITTPAAHGEITHMEAIAANCYLDGNIEYWFCEACGQAWLDADCTRNTNLLAVILPSQGHSFADGVCGVCGEADPDYVPPVEDPIKVTGLTCTDTTRTEISLSWNALEGAVKYWVYVNGKLYTSTQNTTVTVTGRKVNTEYEIYVLANFSDKEFLLAENADVITVTTDDYNYWSNAVGSDNSISVTWEAEGCTKAWFYYGTDMDSMVLYASSTNGTFQKNNLKDSPVYYVQIAYLIDGKIVYGEIDTVICDSTEYIPV